MLRCTLVLVAVTTIAAPASAQSPQPPWKGQNLQYFPQDITREKLIQRMREFSFALGVRCQYCHPGGDGVSFEGVTALLAMMNSCAPNVSVVNIDNGFGAAYVASLINRL